MFVVIYILYALKWEQCIIKFILNYVQKVSKDDGETDRCVVWKMARMDKIGNIPDEPTKQVVDRIVSICLIDCLY